LAVIGRFEADNGRDAGRRFLGRAIAPAAVIDRWAAFGAGALAHFRQLFNRGVAVIGFPLGEQLAGDFGMAIAAGELKDRLAVPIKAEPFHALENRLDRRIGGAFAIGIFDPEQEFAV